MRLLARLILVWGLSVTVAAAAQQELIPIIRQARKAGKPVLSEWRTFVRVSEFQGASYVSLVQASALLNGDLRWNTPGKYVDFLIGGQTIRLLTNSNRVLLSGKPVELESPTVKNDDGFWVPLTFLASSTFFEATRTKMQWPVPPEPVEPEEDESPKVAASKLAKPVGPMPVLNPLKAKALKRIIIDPGHGGKDPGAVGRDGAMEKDINLRMSLDLAELLRNQYGYEVLLTRMDDTFIPLEDRSKLANKHNGDLFISLHCNASPSTKRKGFEVYFLSERASDPHADAVARLENAVLALEGKEAPTPSRVKQVLRSLEITANINEGSVAGALIDRQMSDRLSEPSLGVKQAAFYVLRGAEMPAVLVEMAFISNRAEERLLQSASFRKRLVEGIGAGVAAYDLRKQKERS